MKFQAIVLIFISMLLDACSRSLPFSNPSFDVMVDSTSHTSGVTSLFTFKGDCSNLLYYSGEWGMRYAYANRYNDTSGTDILSFTSAKNTIGNTGTLSLLLSTDFSNDTSKLSEATWTDLGSVAQISWATSPSAISSGNIDLTSYKNAGKPIWLAFRYVADAGLVQSKWTISALTLVHQPTNDTGYTILNPANYLPTYTTGAPGLVKSPGWVGVNVSRNDTSAQLWSPTISTSATTSLVIAGATSAGTAVSSEQWIVAGPIDLTSVLRDVPTAVLKGGTTNYTVSLANIGYSYIYGSVGTYDATFVGINSTINNADTLVKTVQMTIK